jgi:glycerol-3-phosphate dehydrogenase
MIGLKLKHHQMNRQQNIERLKSETFDVCIIGAGSSGLGCALDAALRGMKVCVVDADDFAAGTSSRSTKLIHGGVRYLEQAFKKLDFGQLAQVRHGLAERHILLKNAPHLSQPLGLVTPVANWFEAFYYSVGLKLYGIFAKNDTMPKANWLSKKNTFAQIPTLTKKLHSSVKYYDGQLDDARYCVALAQTAQQAGVVLANYVAAEGFEQNENGKLSAVKVNDLIDNQRFVIKSKIFINCTGPYADAIRLMANETLGQRIKPSKGVHVVVPKEVLNSEAAILIPKTSDGRVVFVIPFEDQVMIGTTDDEYKDLNEEPVLIAEEVDFLLETANRFLDKPIEKSQIKAGFGGIRPLVAAAASSDRSTKRLLRDHEVEVDPQSGLVSLLGGKWTTYRLMAKDTIDAVAKMLNNTAPCITEAQLLFGAKDFSPNTATQMERITAIDYDICKHLNQKYGSEAPKITTLMAENPHLRQRLHEKYPYVAAEVVYQCQAEMAMKPRDILARRLRFELTDWAAAKDSVDAVCALMQPQLGWSDDHTKHEAEAYKQQLAGFMKAVG